MTIPRELEQPLLDDAFVDRLANAIAPRLAARLAGSLVLTPEVGVGSAADGPATGARTRLVTAGELAHVLGVSRSSVYEHADELGAMKVGNGARPRLRFDPQRALAAWGSRSTSNTSQATDRQAAQGDPPRTPTPSDRRMPQGMPAPGPAGSVLALKPRRAGADRSPATGSVLAVKPRSR